ncbi:hypothetical protein N7468_004125, partial [Penicillium chermesinum]
FWLDAGLRSPRGTTPTVDIVFVHGLNGNPKDSWTSKSGCFWPADLLPEVLGSARILSYGYNANVTAFTDGASRDSIVSHAETLASTLAANLVKRALIYSRSLSNEKTEHLRSVYVSTFGILFLGTPHNGSDVAKWGLLLHNICTAVLPKKFMEGSSQLVQSLRTNNETLQHINSLFADIQTRFHIYFFHETRSMDVRGTRVLIVDEASAAPYMDGVERMGIEADHSHMCKFDNEYSPGYEVVAEAILRYSREAPAVIANRWVEEHRTRELTKKLKAQEIYGDREEHMSESVPNPTTGETSHQHMLPAPEDSVTLKHYEIEEPSTSLLTCSIGPHVPLLPPGPASEGQRTPPPELTESADSLPRVRKDAQLFVAPPGFHPNLTFYGMKREMEVLHTRLYRAKGRKDRTMAVLISGVTGSGKTHLARQYVFTYRECYPGGIFWIDAKSRESAYKCFWDIAQRAGIIARGEAQDPNYKESRTYVTDVRDWLEKQDQWLLVFDGITFDHDDDINGFRPFLPWNKRCSIIYTSVDTTLRRKSRLFEPYCILISRLSVQDACDLLFRDLGIKKPTPEQAARATEIVEYYECLPLAIHAIGHRLNATSKPIEKHKVKHHPTDKKLAEPFLSIMNDLFRLKQFQALNLINLLSFLGHHIPVGLLQFGRHAMSARNVEILTSNSMGEDPDLDTTLGTLIHYGLIERTTSAQSFVTETSASASHSADEVHSDGKTVPELAESFTGNSQDGFFSIYNGKSGEDVVKVHSVVQGFCRDELRIRDEETKGKVSTHDAGFYDSWLIVAIHFLYTSYEAARERMSHYSCGLVRDYREYETHASRLIELFPKRSSSTYPPVLREARKNLQELLRSLKDEIERMSPSSSQESARKQRSVFDRSSSSSSSYPDSSADEGISRQSTWPWTDDGSRTDSPEDMTAPPRFQLEPFAPHIFRQAGYESEEFEGYETDGEARVAPRMSPALSQLSQSTEKPRRSPAASPPDQSDEQGWQMVEGRTKPQSIRERQSKRRPRGPRRLRSTKPPTPVVKISPVQGRGSSSRVSKDSGSDSTILASAAERALAALRRSISGQENGHAVGEQRKPTPPMLETPQPNKENVRSYATVAARRIQETQLPPRRPASVPSARPADPVGLQMKPSVESLDSQASYVFASPLARELAPHELASEPLMRSTYSEPGRDFLSQSVADLNLHTAPGSQLHSRRGSLAPIDSLRDLSASTPAIFPYTAALPYDQDITVSRPSHPRWAQATPIPAPAPGPAYGSPIHRPQIVPIAHPSAMMPGALPLSMPTDAPITQTMHHPEHPGSEALSRGSSSLSHQSWATEPVRYPPRFSPLPTFHQPDYQQPGEMPRSPTPMIASQAQLPSLSGTGGWASEVPILGSALQSDTLYPIPVGSRSRVGSVDARLQAADPGWNPEMEPAQLLHFGGHRVDVRDARQRLNEAARLQLPRHVPAYQLYHPNLSGPLIQDGGLVYAPAPALEVYGTRARSGSSPPSS